VVESPNGISLRYKTLDDPEICVHVSDGRIYINVFANYETDIPVSLVVPITKAE
jgi:hypothetical protein